MKLEDVENIGKNQKKILAEQRLTEIDSDFKLRSPSEPIKIETFNSTKNDFVEKIFGNKLNINGIFPQRFAQSINDLSAGKNIDEAYETIYKVLKGSDVEVPPLPKSRRTLEESLEFFDLIGC